MPNNSRASFSGPFASGLGLLVMMVVLGAPSAWAEVAGSRRHTGAVTSTAAHRSEPSIAIVWVAEGFSEPEGITVGPDGTVYVSNVAGDPADADANGWISVFTDLETGKNDILIDGLNAPRGLAVHDGRLFAADLGGVSIINLDTNQTEDFIAIDDAGFPNDVTVWNGEVYVSDSGPGEGIIYKLTANGAAVFVQDERLNRANGLLGVGDVLYAVTMESGTLYEINGSGTITNIASGMMAADGVGQCLDGNFVISSFSGQIYHVSIDRQVTLMLDTSGQGVGQNDLAITNDLVIVPNWGPGTVTAYRLD